MLKDYQKKILELMIKEEALLSQLYGIFAEKFPDYKDFWGKLSEEEKLHAGWIKGLYKAEKEGEVLFHEDNVKTYTLKSFIEHVESILEKAKGTITLKQALAATLDLEMSLIEKNIFSHFSSVSDKMSTVLKLLEDKTKEHTVRVREVVNKAR